MYYALVPGVFLTKYLDSRGLAKDSGILALLIDRRTTGIDWNSAGAGTPTIVLHPSRKSMKRSILST
jgi:hypothetical protein